MFHLDNSSGIGVMPELKQALSRQPQWFTEGDTQTPPSYPGADWFNIVQAELLNVLKAGDITPEKVRLNQLSNAIKNIINKNQNDASLTGKGAVKLSSSIDSESETEAATPLAIKTVNINANNAHDKISNISDKFQFDESESRVRSPNKKVHLIVRNDGVIGSYNIEQEKILWAFGGGGVLGEGKVLADNVLHLYDFVRNMFSTGWNDYGGFFKIPGGLLVQFGRTSYVESTGAGGTVQPFFTAFPNGCLSIVCGDLDGGANTVSAIAISKTHFKCWGKNAGRYANTALYYVAIGV